MSIDISRTISLFQQSSSILRTKQILVASMRLSQLPDDKLEQRQMILQAKNDISKQFSESYWNKLIRGGNDQNHSTKTNQKVQQQKLFPYSQPHKTKTQQKQDIVNNSAYINQVYSIICDIFNVWAESLLKYEQYRNIYSNENSKIIAKIVQLRKNTKLLTKSEQLLSQIEETIQKYLKISDPVIYYDINHRITVSTGITAKLQQINTGSQQTKQSTTPLYSHKIQKQSKKLIYSAHYQQSIIDCRLNQTTYQMYLKIDSKIKNIFSQIKNGAILSCRSGLYVETQARQFFNANSNIFEKEIEDMTFQKCNIQKYQNIQKKFLSSNPIVDEGTFNRYYMSLSSKIKNIYQHQREIRKILLIIIKQILQNVEKLKKIERRFQEKQFIIMKNLQNITNDIGRVFQVQIIYDYIKKFYQNFQIQSLCFKLQRYSDFMHKMQKNSKDYLDQTQKKINQRAKAFKKFLLEDKLFFQEHSKNQKNFIYNLIQTVKQALQNCHQVVKSINIMSSKQKKIFIFEQFQINKIVNKLIIKQEQTRTLNSSEDQRMIANNKNELMSNQKIASHKGQDHQSKNEKLSKIEKIVKSIFIYDYVQKQGGFKQFAVALGPKFLLHGKIFVCSQGIYYQSYFNKKNLFFGKTRIFIPRDDITEIDQKNTLYIFPDAIQIKTIKGSVYFHALGARQKIADVLTSEFFPENNRNDVSCIEEQEFCEYTPPQIIDISKFYKLLQPLEQILAQNTFQGCKLNRIFKRYFSDDKFQIRGKIYENFKVYFLEQIEAIDPKGTQLTPQPPSYFTYKSEQSPELVSELSQRLFTYRKALPKIPFISKGGEGLCQQRQTYHWCSPQLLIIDIVSVVKGFSLTEGMQVLIKTVLKQDGNNVKLILSGAVVFSSQSSKNNLVRTPALSNLKSSSIMMCQIMQKYEKGKRGTRQNRGNIDTQQQDNSSQQKIEILREQNKKLKQNIMTIKLSFVGIYLLTFLLIFIFLKV